MDAPSSHLHLNKKMGGLPAKAWLGIGVVGIIGGLYYRSHHAAAATATPTTSTDPNAGQLPNLPADSASSGGGGSSGVDTSSAPAYLPDLSGFTNGTVNPDAQPSVTNINIEAPAQSAPGSTPAATGTATGARPEYHAIGHSSRYTGAGHYVKSAPKRKSNPPAKPHHTTHHATVTKRHKPARHR